MPDDSKTSPRDAERVSLEGLDPEEALQALLAVDPDSDPVADDEDEDEADGSTPDISSESLPPAAGFPPTTGSSPGWKN